MSWGSRVKFRFSQPPGPCNNCSPQSMLWKPPAHISTGPEVETEHFCLSIWFHPKGFPLSPTFFSQLSHPFCSLTTPHSNYLPEPNPQTPFAHILTSRRPFLQHFIALQTPSTPQIAHFHLPRVPCLLPTCTSDATSCPIARELIWVFKTLPCLPTLCLNLHAHPNLGKWHSHFSAPSLYVSHSLTL